MCSVTTVGGNSAISVKDHFTYVAAPAATIGPDPVVSAENLILEGKGAEAVVLLQPVVKANVGDARTWSLLGRAYRLAKRGTDAIEAFERALALEPNEGASLLGSCLARAERGDTQPAVLACTKALARQKDDPSLQLSLGLSYMQAGKPADALPLLETVARQRPKEADVLVPLGRTYLHLRRWAEAKAELTRAIAADPTRTLPKELLARALFELDDATGATKLWREVLLAEPSNEDARQGVALALRKSQSPDVAAQSLKLLSQASPDDVNLLRERAGAEVDAKHWDEAAVVIEKLVAKKAATPAQIHNLAVAYSELGQHAKAVTTLEGVVGAPDVRPETRLLYGAALAGAGRRDDARSAYEALARDAQGSALAERAAAAAARLKESKTP